MKTWTTKQIWTSVQDFLEDPNEHIQDDKCWVGVEELQKEMQIISDDLLNIDFSTKQKALNDAKEDIDEKCPVCGGNYD